ncbi:hypothetical protein G7Y89_g9557 [Cudoniella acicularis]|uniref:Uncharacterized protein n=1 Tax=Cudoniella acicularis TaxID=354080 RepID=A0A8H4REF3_9HELO|nr:hypothetical protein G7Y89_g9557 [Cudoniella acicularis]
MKLSVRILSALILYGVCQAAPTLSKDIVGRETTDGDDKVVYTWSKPEEKREETADGDDQVVYTWSKPEEKREETADGDDQVVYTWSKPESQ